MLLCLFFQTLWYLKTALWTKKILTNHLVGLWRIVKNLSTEKYRFMTFPIVDMPVKAKVLWNCSSKPTRRLVFYSLFGC